MSETGAGPVAVPARVTITELARLLAVDIAAVEAVISARHGSPDVEYVGFDTTTAVAKALGRSVAVEPRDLALEALYAREAGGEPPVAHLVGRALGLVTGVLEQREQLDHEIESASEHWSIARMPAIDRTILRMGLYELTNEPGTPTAVIVSEAVRLAKVYSTERSGAFVNGVLASLARRVRS